MEGAGPRHSTDGGSERLEGAIPPGRLPSAARCYVVRAGAANGCGAEEEAMPNSVYKVIEIVGSSPDSWEKAAAAAVEQASRSLRDLRVAEVESLDMHLENGKITAYRAKLKVSFKFEGQ
jgi:flavin-binding protein dodecin